jgi:hypothetical protein
MNKTLIALSLVFMTGTAIAAPASSRSARANSSASTQSSAASANSGQGNGNALTLNSTAVNPDHISETVRSAPGLGANFSYGSASQGSCMVSGSAQMSVIGFGVGGTTPIQDENCNQRQDFTLLMQTAVGTRDPQEQRAIKVAAFDRLCSRGGDLYNDLERQGLCETKRDINGKAVDNQQNHKVTAIAEIKPAPGVTLSSLGQMYHYD